MLVGQDAVAVHGRNCCLFGSDFPVDGLFGTYADLLGSYVEITKRLAEGGVHKLFVFNAERLYRI